jgi:phosphonoacetaldehyde hydrolase
VLETVETIRDMGIKIGSTTGYTRERMDIVAPIAQKNGYFPDSIVCPEECGGKGRPFPYMIWRNLEILGCADIGAVIKIGDTQADMQEGRAAGCISVGVIEGSSVLGLSQNEMSALAYAGTKDEVFANVRKQYFESGADFVIDNIKDLPKLIVSIGG